MLYKMDLLCVEDDLFSVVNIRLNLEQYQFKKRMSKLLRKNDERFTVIVGPAKIDQARERLYELQRPKFTGFIHSTLNDYLHSGLYRTVFDTWEIAVYDNQTLASVSFLDLGENSVASLLGLIDPNYKKYSLGIYTMLYELQHSINICKKWYYPGYILDKTSSFSYKLRLGDFEFYNSNRRWSKMNNYNAEHSVAFNVKSKIAELQKAFEKKKLNFDYRLYPYFSMGYMYTFQVKFVPYPILLHSRLFTSKGVLFASYDLEKNQFAVFYANQAEDYSQLVSMEMSEEYANPIYLNDLLQIDAELNYFANASDAAGFVRKKLKE